MRKQKGWQDIIGTLLYGLAVAAGLILAHILVSDRAEAAEPSRAQMQIYAAQVEVNNKLPTGLLLAICEQESHWRNVAGQHGEIGVCQLKPDTVRMVCDCDGNARQLFYRRGSTGDVVRQIQAQLARWGLYSGRVDGAYGPVTERAVTAMQQLMQIPADGVVGPKTWTFLFRGYEPYPGGTITSALWNPYENIEWAAAYLVWLRELLGTEDPAVLMAAYNGGPANPVVKYVVSVQRRMARGAM